MKPQFAFNVIIAPPAGSIRSVRIYASGVKTACIKARQENPGVYVLDKLTHRAKSRGANTV